MNPRYCQRCNAPMDGGLKCLHCGEWHHIKDSVNPGIIRLSEVEDSEENRFVTGESFDVVFGGGLVPCTTVLLGGEPGAGKSTLVLQIAEHFPEVLYIAAEENGSQIKGRARRIGIKKLENIMLMDAIGGKPGIDELLMEIHPGLVILDSLPGFVGQGPGRDKDAMDILVLLKQYAIANQITVLILDHITKADLFAGRMSLQHEVDATIGLLVDEETQVRTLQTIKNRHGASGVKVEYVMTGKGLMDFKGYGNTEDTEE